MELICPDCRGELQVGPRRSAHCPLHGGQYEVLFDREVESMTRTAERPAAMEGKTCEAHPRQSAVADCARCGKALCAVCSFDVAGRHYCSDCALSGAQARPAPVSRPVPVPVPVPVLVPEFTPAPLPPPEPAQSQTYVPAIATAAPAPVAYEPPTLFSPVTSRECPMCATQNAPTAVHCAGCGRQFGLFDAAPPPRRSSVPVGLMCAQHLESQAVAQCRACSAGLCVTCDFQLPGGVHVCPECIDKAGDEEVSPRRKRLMVWSLVVVVYTTVMMALLITGALHRALAGDGGTAVVEATAGYGIFMPAIVGTALAFGAFDRRLRNTPLIWTSVIWNSVILGFFLILIVIGLLS